MFWRVIASNRRRTVILVLAMAVMLAALGYLIGEAVGIWTQYTTLYGPPADAPALRPGHVGIMLALAFWLVLLLLSFLGSDQLFLSLAGAREVSHDMFPQLYNVVEEMKIAAALPAMPRIYIVDDPAPNAFAVGKSPKNSSVCVTAGLLSMCGRDELQGVVAHEMGHIVNRDVLYMTVAATMMGAVTILSDSFLRSMRFAPAARCGSSGGKVGKGGANLWVVILAFAFVILSPILSRLLYFCISRSREYLADATSARLTRYPEGLAAALEKMLVSPIRLTTAPRAIAPFYIVNPYVQELDSGLFATHPPLSERVRILRSMDRGASFKDYAKAYRKVTHSRRPLIPDQDLHLGGKVAKRGPSEEPGPGADDTVRNSRDIMRAVNSFVFISCPCGMRMKVPPEFSRGSLSCPRCGRDHLVQEADLETVGAMLAASSAFTGAAPIKGISPEASGAGSERQVEKRVPGTWQTFVCRGCGRNVQVSSAFALKATKCSKCGHGIYFSDGEKQGGGS